MKFAFFVVVGAAVALLACSKGRQSASAPADPSLDSPYVKIWVSRTGDIQLDGKPADLTSVEAALSALTQKHGEVFYGRDGAGGEPHPNSMKIIQMIVTKRLPIRLSTKPDFSDAVEMDGKPH